MRRVDAVIWLLACGGLVGAARAEEAVFRHRAPIVVAQAAAFVQLPLPASVYGHSLQAGLRDLRVVDARGERVPFALLAPRAAESSRSELPAEVGFYPLPPRPARGTAWASPLELTVQGGRVSVRPLPAAPAAAASPGWLFDLGERSPEQAPPDSLRLAWSGPAEFSAGFSLQSSDDLREWRDAGAGQVMALASPRGALTQPGVPLPPTAGRFVRLQWDEPAEAPRLSGVTSLTLRRSTRALDEPSVLSLSPSAEPAGSGSGRPEPRALHFDLGGVLPLSDVDLRWEGGTRVAPVRLQGRDTPEQPWQELGGAVFYRLQREGGVSTSPALPLPTRLRYLRVLADERAAPLDPAQTRLVVHAALGSLVFAAQGSGPWTLLAGEPRVAEGALPVQTLVPDLARERPRFGRATLGPWSEVPEAVAAAAAERRWALWRPRLLWAVLLVGVAGLGLMVWRLAGGRVKTSAS